MDHESVARLRAFDVEGSCFRIASALGALHTGGIKAARVDRVGDHGIAGLDPKRGFMGAGKGVVELGGFKSMGLGEGSNGQGQREQQFHVYPPVWTSIAEELRHKTCSNWRQWAATKSAR